ncbi:cytochrome c oxidase assembly protein [Solwaraspora sp. WMMD791]|uniref:cytochrome c oxidase assembly protein n=1 Tax=Solwaraspora sp. WMMD791 TaxID=3016086 RepID=UPI00249ACD78|nr:cytochrome c oxidase assembly protein [Solwaraspora sp. WMMD791]WFE26048.1 cytochrome c oxidase assembly protein [Solwaraspora sp. WMMD791]
MTVTHGIAGAGYWSLLLLLLGAVAVGYLVAASRTRHGWHDGRVAALLAGVLLVAMATGPGLSAWAMHDPRGHMVQHLLVGMFAPLVLVFAAPVTVLLRAVSPVRRRGLARLLSNRVVHLIGHPVTALVLATGGMYLVYLTPIYALTHRMPLLQLALHAHFFIAGYLFVWSIAGPDPAPRRPRLWVRVTVLTTSVAAHAYLAKFLYAHPDVLASGSGADLVAARQAAQLMYYGGDAAELLLAVALFVGWYRRRSRRAGVGVGGAGGHHRQGRAETAAGRARTGADDEAQQRPREWAERGVL